MNPAETGWFYLNSRYYDPETGRFINADAPEMLGLDQGNLLQYNLYAYCYNNPVMNSDQVGYFPALVTILAGAIIGGVLGAIIDAVIQIQFDKKSFSKLDWKSIGIEFVSGALTGALIACNLPAPVTNLGRGIIGMMSSLMHSIKNRKFKTISGAFSAIGSAIISGAVSIVINQVKWKYGKTLNYKSTLDMIKKIGITRAVRGGIRFSAGWGWFKINIVLN